MKKNSLAWIGSYIWGIADDVLRDLFVRGKYRDVILPMTVRSLGELRADILALGQETEGLLGEIIGGKA